MMTQKVSHLRIANLCANLLDLLSIVRSTKGCDYLVLGGKCGKFRVALSSYALYFS